MTRPRPILLLAASLALGLITTLASALALGAFVDIPEAPTFLPSVSRSFIAAGRPWQMHETHRLGINRAGWSLVTRRYFTSPDPATPIRNAIERFIGSAPEAPEVLLRDLRANDHRELMRSRGGDTYESRPLWGEFAIGHTPNVPPPRGPATTTGCDVGYGWPCTALWCQVRGHSANLSSWGGDVTGGLIVRGSPSPVVFMFCRIMPYRPAWIGLATNTALFTTLWFLLLFAPITIRRTLRRRSNRCLNCNYDLRATPLNTPCPECGHPR